MSDLPLFPVATVGSWPRPPELLEAQRRLRRGDADQHDVDAAADQAVCEAIRLQERAGCDVIGDGELRRDNFYSFVARKFDGVQMMTLSEMLDLVEDKDGFEALLQSLDVPAYAISNPTCVGRLSARAPLALDDLRFLRLHTDRPVKVTLPGPYLLTRAMFVPEVTRDAYATKEDLAEDVVRLLRDELEALARAGAEFVQLDEPVLTELAFSSGHTRTFMCAALAAHKDPAEELDFAVSLINRVVEGFTGVRLGVHVCRGNWSRNEDTLLRGGYHPLVPYLTRLHVSQLVLEYATDRAGALLPFDGKEIGLGVVNPRTDAVETPAEIRQAIEAALKLYPAEKIFLNPDCGFATFSRRPMSSTAIAAAKLSAMTEAARTLRGAA